MNTILIGVSSGIAAFKALDVVRGLRKRGYRVVVLMTDSARKMVPEKDFEKASGNRVLSQLFPRNFNYKKVLKERKVEHIQLADEAAVLAILPATANIIANLAHGIAYDLVTTTALATRAPLLVFPSMNVNMWQNPATQENIRTLIRRGAIICEPDCGDLACGYIGKGRLPEPERIVEEIVKLAEKRKDLAGKRVIVTAGGTEESIDDVRVITNKSSGKMGIALAEECRKRGAQVTLIRARTEVEPSVFVKDIRVHSAEDMLLALKKRVKDADYVFHAAAVSDYTLRKRKGKLNSKKNVKLLLRPTPKIIDKIKRWNRRCMLVGFKAEYGKKKMAASAHRLLLRSGADLIVANDISAHPFGKDSSEMSLVRKKWMARLPLLPKPKIAEAIVDSLVGAKAFAPANVSCIFQVYGRRGSSKRGSLGVGFTLDKGAIVQVRYSDRMRILVNGKPRNFPTVKDVVQELSPFPLEVSIASELPFGCGFGMSGASALATALAIGKLLRLKKSREELALVAHRSEVRNSTGLGDVAGQYTGGFMIRRKNGNPLAVERLPVSSHLVYFKAFGPIETRKVINSARKLRKLNLAGATAMARIGKRADFRSITEISKEFALSSGLLRDRRVKKLIEAIEKKGGRASMIMLGNAVFSTIPFKGCSRANIVEEAAKTL